MTGVDATSAHWAAAFARACAFAATAPLAGSGAVPKALRVAIALALTPAVAPHVVLGERREFSELLWVENAFVGAAFGLAAAVVASAASSAGATVDAALASRIVGREAVFGGEGGPFARLYALAFASAFLGSGAMTLMCERFAFASSTVALAPTPQGAVALVRACFESAIAIAAPALVAQLVGTVVAATVARAAPRINGLMLASPLVSIVLLVSMLAAAEPTFARILALARSAASAPAL